MSLKQQLFFAVLFPSFALADCPDGFELIGRMSKESSGQIGKEAKVEAEEAQVNLPPGFELDTSYQQGTFKASGGSARAVTSAGEIPPGFHLVAKGSESGCAGWSVHRPETKVLQRQGNTIMQEALSSRLYCHTGSGELCKDGAGCNVSIEVCAKKKN